VKDRPEGCWDERKVAGVFAWKVHSERPGKKNGRGVKRGRQLNLDSGSGLLCQKRRTGGGKFYVTGHLEGWQISKKDLMEHRT